MLKEFWFRDANVAERQLIDRLLEAEFVGRNEIASQLKNYRVRRIDSEGSLEVKPSERATPAAVVSRIPVEAESTDQDGIGIHVLLHVVNGIVNELEIYKDDGSSIKHMPNPTDFKLVVAPRRPS